MLCDIVEMLNKIYLSEILDCDQSEFEVEASEKESIQGLKAEGSHSEFAQLRGWAQHFQQSMFSYKKSLTRGSLL